MSSMKGKITRLLGNTILHTGTVAQVDTIGRFRKLLIRGDFPAIQAGTKVQLLLPSDDMRTYSPIVTPDGMILLGWMLAGGPGAHWMSSAEMGDQIRFVGPQRSLTLSEEPVILFGDETSIAVAAAFNAARPNQIQLVLAATDVEDVQKAAAAFGLDQAVVHSASQVDELIKAVVSACTTAPEARIILTGGASLIVTIRDALRQQGMRDIKTKTYWIAGRTGLD